MDDTDFGAALRALHALAPTAVGEVIGDLARRAGATDSMTLLVDFEQTTLLPLPDGQPHVDLPVPLAVQDTTAGLALRDRRVLTEAIPGASRVWVPVLEGTDCTGVLGLIFGAGQSLERSALEELGMFAGLAILAAARATDLYNLVRRRKAMSLPASMQWDLLPPLRLHVPEATSVGMLEPAYDVGGDSFDHVVNGSKLDLVVMDAMGHGLSASVVSALAMGSYRHDRREGQPLEVVHRRLDRIVGEQFGGEPFVTGLLAQLDLRDGELRWTNAGHPAPLLVHGGSVRPLRCEPSLPWGLGGALAEQASHQLQPGDGVVLYTDGVVEGRNSDGVPFGVDRFVDLVAEAARSSSPSDAAVRRLVHDALAYQDHRLRDDATVIWVTWRGQA